MTLQMYKAEDHPGWPEAALKEMRGLEAILDLSMA